jgi:hypothetical protein
MVGFQLNAVWKLSNKCRRWIHEEAAYDNSFKKSVD